MLKPPPPVAEGTPELEPDSPIQHKLPFNDYAPFPERDNGTVPIKPYYGHRGCRKDSNDLVDDIVVMPGISSLWIWIN